MHFDPKLLRYVIPLLIIIPLMYRRISKMTKPQPLKLNRLWIRPALLVVVGGLVLVGPQPPGTPPLPPLSPGEWGGLALAALLGAVAGWYYGKQMTIEVHPQDGTLMTRGGLAAIMVIVVLIAVKLGLRPLLAAEGGNLHTNALLLSDASIVFSLFLFSIRSLEMYLRARRILAK